jgi:hypothetical protein
MLDSYKSFGYDVPCDGESPVRPEGGSLDLVLVRGKHPGEGG